MTAGSFDKTASGSWRGRVMIDGHRYTRTGDTKRDVQQQIAKVVADAAKFGDRQRRPGRVNQSSPTLSTQLEAWYAENVGDWSPGYALDVRSVIDNHITPALGDYRIARLHQTDLNGLYQSLPVSPARVRRVHNVIARALEQAMQDDIIPTNPARKARPPAVRSRDIEPPTPEQVVKIVTVADTVRPGLAMFVHLAAVTGARRGELCALRWSDVAVYDNGQRGSLTIGRAIAVADGDHGCGRNLIEKDTKTHAIRRLALDHGVVDALAAHHQTQQDQADELGVELVDDPRLFPGTGRLSDRDAGWGDLPWRPEVVSRDFAAAVKAAGLTGVRLHDLRHAAATQMMAAGVDVVTGANRLGHRNRSTFLNRYAHAVPAADAAAADTLADIYRIGGTDYSANTGQ